MMGVSLGCIERRFRNRDLASDSCKGRKACSVEHRSGVFSTVLRWFHFHRDWLVTVQPKIGMNNVCEEV